jgi:uncharacterized protein (DUF885 family)
MNVLRCVLLGCCLSAVAFGSGCGEKPPVAFDRLVDEFIDGYFAAHPVTATATGAHQFDAELDDLSPEAVAAEIARLKDFRERIRTFPTRKLDRDDRIDLAILADRIDLELLEMEEIKEWKRDPLLYTRIIGDGIYLLLARDFAPLEERLGNAALRLEKVPRVLEQAKRNLDLPAQVFTETAIRQNLGNIDLIRKDLAEAARGAPALEARIAEASTPALTALEDFQKFLETDLLPRSGGSFRLGPELHLKKLNLTLQSSIPPQEILRRAWGEFYRVRDEMFELARQIHEERFPGTTPTRTGTDVEQRLVRKVLAMIADEHPTEDNVLPFIQQTLDNLEAFIREKDLLTLDESQKLVVTWMPEYSSGVAIAGLESPGPLERHLDAFYYVMPIPPDWSAAQAESFFREYNNYMVQILTIHEAMPGHFVQIYHANRDPSIVRQVFSSGTFVEGWAVYCERMMIEAGYMDFDPRLKLQQLKFYLRTVINAILDAEVHSGTITEEAAIDLLVNGGYQEESEARGKWTRACLTSAQLSTYFAGVLAVSDLREKYRKMKGDEFRLNEFHEAVLGHGSPPPKYLEEILLSSEP